MSINLQDITLTYPDGDTTVTALDHVDLDVQAGQLHAIVGPSGSGKSSLLAVAATLIAPSSGGVYIDGVDTNSHTAASLTRLRLNRIGIVFQQPNLLSSLTALDQLLITAHMRSQPPRDHRAAASRMLATVGLDGKQHRRPATLSGGERQRVNIARALMGDPAVLLVDEPTAALDRERGAQVMSLLAEVSRTYQLATVIVTHDTEHLALADRASILRDGRLEEQDALAQPVLGTA